MTKTNSKEIISNIKNEIEPMLGELKGQDPETVYQTLKGIVTKYIPAEKWNKLSEESVIIKGVLPEENPAEPWNKKNAGIVNGNLESSLRSLATDISQGKDKSQGNSKRLKFTVPINKAELASLRNQPKNTAIEYIKNKVIAAVQTAGYDINELNKGQTGVNFKNQGSRSASIKTTGHTLLEAVSEIIYASAISSRDMNAEAVKSATEQSLKTGSNTGMQAGNMIDDMVNSGDSELEQNEQGFTYSG